MEEIKMHDIQEQLTRVLETHRTGDFNTARSDCAELMASSPEVPDTHFVMGLLVQDSGDHAGAIQLIGRAIRLSPERSDFHDALGVSQVSLGKHRDGLRSFAEAVRLNPENRLAVMHLGLLALRLGLAERALPCFESLMRMGETSIELICLRGQALYKMERHTEAVEWLHKCLDMSPNHLDAHRYLGRALMSLNRFTEAATCFRTVADAEAGNSRVRTLLGEALMRAGDLEPAESVLHESIDLDHSQPEAHAHLGDVQAALGLADAPLRSYLTALRLRPQDHRYRCQLGYLLMDQGFLPKQNIAFAWFWAVNPTMWMPSQGSQVCLSKMGDPEGAFALTEPMISSGTDHADLAHIYAMLCRKLGRSHDAIPVLQKLLSRSRPLHTRAKLQHALGELFEAVGLHEEAFAAHKEANEVEEVSFNPAAFESKVSDLIEVFDRQLPPVCFGRKPNPYSRTDRRHATNRYHLGRTSIGLSPQRDRCR